MPAGVWAAWRWLKAAAVSVPRTLTTEDGSHLVLRRMVESHRAMIAAAHLNKSAALFTAAAAFLSALSATAAIAG